MTYSASVFDCDTVEKAKEIILTPHNGLTTDERWQKETPVIVQILRQQFASSDTLLDYGCGIGRIAKELPNPIVGIDISLSMRQMAIGYVARNNFLTAHPDLLPTKNAYRGCYAIWTIQHIEKPILALMHIRDSLIEGARLVIIGTKQRFVPTEGGGWLDDKENINDHMTPFFDLVYEYPFASDLVGADCATVSIWRKQ